MKWNWFQCGWQPYLCSSTVGERFGCCCPTSRFSKRRTTWWHRPPLRRCSSSAASARPVARFPSIRPHWGATSTWSVYTGSSFKFKKKNELSDNFLMKHWPVWPRPQSGHAHLAAIISCIPPRSIDSGHQSAIRKVGRYRSPAANKLID